MPSRLQITFRGLPPSEAIEERVRERAEKLDSLCDRITSCHVLVEAPHAHHHKGKLYEIHLNILVPRHEIVVSRASNANHAHEDAYVAIRDAFDAATRQLEDYVRRQRGDVKAHASGARQAGGNVPAED
jgi:ribosome-associated translation inhibitor RaiA